MLSFVLGKCLEVVGTNKLLLIKIVIPHDIVGKGDTLINKEQPCLADKEAAWEIIRQKKTPHETQREACKLQLLLFYPASLNSGFQYPK